MVDFKGLEWVELEEGEGSPPELPTVGGDTWLCITDGVEGVCEEERFSFTTVGERFGEICLSFPERFSPIAEKETSISSLLFSKTSQ